MTVEAPAGGDALSGAWTSVYGWVDPQTYHSVAVLGAPVDGFYEPAGHVGIPSATVTLRSDGRFVAPQVPLAPGSVEIVVVPLTTDGPGNAVRIDVTAAAGAAPATLVASPTFARPNQAVALTASTSPSVPAWQWDYEGDGVFDEESTGSVSHAFAAEGRYLVTARTRVGSRWLYATAPVTVLGDPPVTHSTDQVSSPRAIAVVSAGLDTADDELAGTRHVLVADGDQVKVFDAKLSLLRTLTGLTRPAGIAEDAAGLIYVADTGADRIVRFLLDGSIDPGFGTGGSFRGPPDAPLSAPGPLAVFEDRLLVLDGAGRVRDCSQTACRDSLPALAGRTDAPTSLAIPASAGAFQDGSLWIALFGDTLARQDLGGDWQTLQGPSTARAVATSGAPGTEYWAADAAGVIHEYSFGAERRQFSPGSPVTVLACDDDAAAFYRYRQQVETRVLYLGGAGRLERRVLANAARGLQR
jgi:hypothetical protein